MNMKITTLLVAALPMLIAGCATRGAAPLETVYQTVNVEVPAPCPEKVVGAQLLAERPVPLRLQPKPADPSVRSAKSQAQLGKYEAEGGWADRVDAALRRCQATN